MAFFIQALYQKGQWSGPTGRISAPCGFLKVHIAKAFCLGACNHIVHIETGASHARHHVLQFSLHLVLITALAVDTDTAPACLLESTLCHTDTCADAVKLIAVSQGSHPSFRSLFLKYLSHHVTHIAQLPARKLIPKCPLCCDPAQA